LVVLVVVFATTEALARYTTIDSQFSILKTANLLSILRQLMLMMTMMMICITSAAQSIVSAAVLGAVIDCVDSVRGASANGYHVIDWSRPVGGPRRSPP